MKTNENPQKVSTMFFVIVCKL